MVKLIVTKFRQDHWTLLSYLTFILSSIVLLPNAFVVNLGTGTDYSYMEALEWIRVHRLPLTYGKDIIYTYGPLGFLCYKIALNWYFFAAIILFDIYIYINCVIILKAFMPVRSVLACLVVFFAVCFFDKQFNEPIYYIIFLFSVYTFLKTGKYCYLLNAVIITIFSFFIKINFGLVQFFVLSWVVLYACYRKPEERKLLAAIVLLTVVSIAILSFVFKLTMVGYIKSSLSLIAGYNDAMLLPVSAALKRLQMAFLIVVVYNLSGLYFMYKSQFKTEFILRYFITSIYLFIIFKYSFVRADLVDPRHGFFIFVFPALAIQYLFEENGYKARLKELSLVSFFCGGIIFFAQNPFMGKPELFHTFSAGLFSNLHDSAKSKFTFSEQTKKSRLFPDNILKKIGNHSVDLMPYNLSLLFINDLNYCPRPTLQSYAAFNSYLDSMNYYKYISDNAPEFVLFNCSGIDNREPFWDEAATKRVLCQYYQVVDSFHVNDAYTNGLLSDIADSEKYLLLQRNASPLRADVKNQGSGELNLNEPFMVDTGAAPQYIYADFEYSMWGNFKSFMFQPPLLNVVFCYQTGNTDTFRIVRPILKTGVLINKEITTTSDAEIFFKTDGTLNVKVKWIKFVSNCSNCFKQKARYHKALISYTK